MTTQQPLLKIRDVATLLGVSVLTIARWTKSGFLPSVKLGRSRRYTAEALDKFIQGGTKLGACGCIGISERAASDEQGKRVMGEE